MLEATTEGCHRHKVAALAAGVVLRLRLPNIKLTSARHSAEYKRSDGTRLSNDATHPP